MVRNFQVKTFLAMASPSALPSPCLIAGPSHVLPHPGRALLCSHIMPALLSLASSPISLFSLALLWQRRDSKRPAQSSFSSLCLYEPSPPTYTCTCRRRTSSSSAAGVSHCRESFSLHRLLCMAFPAGLHCIALNMNGFSSRSALQSTGFPSSKPEAVVGNHKKRH